MNPSATAKNNSARPFSPTGELFRFVLVFFAAFQVSAAPVVVHLQNGDRISGDLVSETTDRVVLKSTFAGEITLPKSEITSRETLDAPKAPAPPPPVAKPVAPTNAAPNIASAKASPTNAPALVAPPLWGTGWVRPFLTNWHGNVGLGMNLGFGATDRQSFFVNANAVHNWERFVNNVSYNAAYGFVNQVEAANRMDGTVKTDLFVGPKKKVYTYNQFLGGYDEIRQIEMRFEEGVGMGYRVYDRSHMVLNLEAGGQYQRFNYSTQPDRSIWSARLGENLVWKPSDKLQVTQRMQFLPNISDPSEYHARFELIASYPLFRKITISLNVTDEYESKPVHDIDKNDLQITTNINIVF